MAALHPPTVVPGVAQLADGRRLSYLRPPQPGPHPVLFCHGTPGTRLFRPPDPMLPSRLGIDLLTVDRPGWAASTPQPGRTILDWGADVAALADHVGWESFSVIGISGGSAFALAAALRLPGRITRVSLVSGLAPFWPGALAGMMRTTRVGFLLARRAPRLLERVVRYQARHPERFSARVRAEVPDADRAVLARPEVAEVVAANLAEAFTTTELPRELVLLRRHWGFDPAEVTTPALVWHGEEDRNVPAAHGRQLAGALADCRARFVPGAGHYLIFDHWAEILACAAGVPLPGPDR